MKEARVAAWLQIAGNMGVLFGLILVSLQISQNTEIARAQIASEFYLADMNLELAMMGENPQASWTRAIYHPDKLSEQDAVVIDRYLNYNLLQLERLRQIGDLGLAYEVDPATTLPWHLGNEAGRRWWEKVKELDWYPDLENSIDQAIGQNQNREVTDAILGKEEASP